MRLAMPRRMFILATALLLAAAGTPAQESRGTIFGRVSDASGAVVPQASIDIRSKATDRVISLLSDGQGYFQASFLVPGAYRVNAEKTGFKLFTGDVEVRADERLEVNAVLQVGDVAQAVVVAEETPLLDATTATLGEVVDEKRITDLPLNGNPYEAMQLAAGVVFAGSATNDRPFDTLSSVGYAIAGVRANRAELSLDGSPNTSTAGVNEVTAAYVPPTDTLREVKVLTATFDAGLGQTEAGVVSMSLKSGGQRLHGTVNYVALPEPASANLFFANRTGQLPRGFNYNRWGATAGGPVVLPGVYNGRRRTFFLYGYEGIHERRPRGNTLTVPTEAERRGDFLALLKLGAQYQIYDPYTRRSVTGGRTQVNPLANNIVPAARLNPVALNILKYYPLPTVSGTTDGQNNLPLPNAPETNVYYNHAARVDHYLGDRQRIFVRLNAYNRDSQYNDWFQTAATGERLQYVSRAGAVDEVYTLSPNSILNVRYGYNRFVRNTDGPPASQSFDLTALGFAPAYNNLIEPRIRRFPYITIAGYAPTRNGVLFRATDTHTLDAAVDRMGRRHGLKIGGEYRVYREDQYNYDNVSTGYFDFNTAWTRGPYDNSGASPIGQGLASLLFGLPTSGYVERRDSYAEQSTVWAGFLQDSWRAARRLTMSAGVRYEIEAGITERYNRSVRGFDSGLVLPIDAAVRTKYATNPTPEVSAAQFVVRGGVNFAGVLGQPRTLWRSDKNNFMPRFGLAYSLSRKTVVRAGYGMFFGFLGARRGDVIQASFSQRTTLVPSIDSGLTFQTQLANPFPSGLVPPTGSSLGPMTYLGQGISFFNTQPLAPYMQRWQVSIQRELPHRIVVEVGYVGNRGTHIIAYRNLDAIANVYLSRSPIRDDAAINYLTASLKNPFYPLLPNTSRASSNIARVDLLRPYPQFTSVMTDTNEGYSWYHAATATVQKRFSRGWTMTAVYTWSKFMEATTFLNEGDPRPARTISDQDFPHRLTLSWIYEFPLGRRRRFFSGARGLAGALTGGWQISGIYAAQSGQAFAFGNIIFYGYLKNVPLHNSQRTIDRWFNTGAGFERNALKALAYNLRTFPLRFAGLRGDGINNFDVSVSKNTRLGERVTLQFRADALNALNHPAFSNPNMDPTSTAFGTVTSQKNYARRLQLGLKLLF
jgi:hypothetical protein